MILEVSQTTLGGSLPTCASNRSCRPSQKFFLAAMAAKTTVGRPEYESVPLLHAENAHLTCTPGSGHYQLIDGNTGAGVEHSTSSRHLEGVHAGYPNPLVQPVDTHGQSSICWHTLCECSNSYTRVLQVSRPLGHATGQGQSGGRSILWGTH